MKLRFAVFLTTLLTMIGLARGQVANPYFYRISKNGVDSFVLGTIHSGVGLNELPPKILEVLHDATTVVGERAWTLQQAERELNPDAVAKEIVSVRAAIRSRKLGQTSREKLLAYGLPRDFVDVIRTEDEFCPFIRGYATRRLRKGMDFEITVFARMNNKRVEELESDSLRMQAIEAAGGHICNVGDLIADSAKPASEVQEDSKVIDQQYRSGRLPVYQMNNTELLYRNERWIARIEELHAKSSVFIFVGALHLTQPGNILEMLKARGFTIQNFSPNLE